MTPTVLVAVADRQAEASLVAAFSRPDLQVSIGRRCLDLTDLLAAAASGAGQVALVSADLPRLDREALARIRACGVAVVGLHADPAGERRLRELGVARLLGLAAPPGQVAALVRAAHREPADPGATATTSLPGTPGPVPAGAGLPGEPGVPGAPDGPAETGQVLAVWGPAGAPGRTLLAATLATELAVLGVPTLLVDADVYAPSIAQLLGLLDETPGLVAAVRDANLAALDLAALAGHSRAVQLPGAPDPGLRVLTGLTRADRWPELRPAALARTLHLARQLAAVTVVDVSSCLEEDEELSFDVAVPRRNGATLAALREADQVLAVGAADPVGLGRLIRGLAEFAEAVPGPDPLVVVNRLRRGPVPGDPAAAVRGCLDRFAGRTPHTLLPEDRGAVDAALAAGRCLAEAAPGSGLRLGVRRLAQQLSGLPDPPPGRRTRRGRGRRLPGRAGTTRRAAHATMDLPHARGAEGSGSWQTG